MALRVSLFERGCAELRFRQPKVKSRWDKEAGVFVWFSEPGREGKRAPRKGVLEIAFLAGSIISLW